MEKPISVMIEDVRNDIISTINSSNLHPSILFPIIKDIYDEVKRAERLQYQREKEEYEKSIKSDEEPIKK